MKGYFFTLNIGKDALMKNVFYKTVFSLLLLISVNAYASHSVPCNACNMSTQARLIADARSPGETFTIIDTTNLRAESYRTELINIGGEPFVVARSIALTSTGRNDLNDIRNSYALLESTIINIPEDLPNTNLPEDIGSSADLILTPTLRGSIGRFVEQESTIVQRASALAATLLRAFGLFPEGIPTEITVRFPDGSTATYRVTGTMGLTLTWDYVEGSARDANGNLVPDSENDFSGTFQFESTEDLENAVNIAELFGVQIRNGQQCTRVKQLTCSTAGGERICVRTVSCL
jgi:hypothetical protein